MKKISNREITPKEQIFCYWYARTGNGREAAQRAGYGAQSAKTAWRLLAQPAVQKRVGEELRQTDGEQEVLLGLRRLAFGNGNDALELLDACDNKQDLDLFHVSEMKRLKDGAVELKFYDRLKAMEKLASLEHAKEEQTTAFYQALERGCCSLEQAQTGEENVS